MRAGPLADAVVLYGDNSVVNCEFLNVVITLDISVTEMKSEGISWEQLLRSGN